MNLVVNGLVANLAEEKIPKMVDQEDVVDQGVEKKKDEGRGRRVDRGILALLIRTNWWALAK